MARTGRKFDLRLVLPAVVAWLSAFVGVLPPRLPVLLGGVCLTTGGLVALVVERRRGGRPGLAATITLAAVASGAVAVSIGLQGLMDQRADLVKAASQGELVTVWLRVDAMPKTVTSQLGGPDRLIIEGQAGGVRTLAWTWPDGPDGRITAGHQVKLRAKAELTGRAEAARVVLLSAQVVEVVLPEGWRRVVFDLRAGLRQAVEPLPAEAAGLLPGITVGDRSGLPAALDQAMKDTSTSHITAVSGEHMAIVLSAVLGLLTLLRLPRAAVAGLAGAILAGFAALCGGQPSVLRAGLMAGVSLMALAMGRRRIALGALCAAVMVLVVIDPYMARSYGLMMSASATGSLILLAPWMGSRLERVMPKRLAQAVALPTSAQLACAPIIVIFAGQASLVSVVANVLAVPALPVATMGGLWTCLVWPFSSELAALGLWPAGLAAWWIATVARWCATWPMATIAWPSGPAGGLGLLGVVLAVAGLAWWAQRWSIRGRGALAAALVAVVLVAGPGRQQLRRLWEPGPPVDWLVAVCDVGQGTAVVLNAGGGAAVLVDAGPEPEAVDRCLSRLKVMRLEAVVLTHFHADHMAGLEGAVRGRNWLTLVHGLPCGGPDAASQISAQARHENAQEITIDSVAGPRAARAGPVDLWLIPSRWDRLCPSVPAGNAAAGAEASNPTKTGAGEDSLSNDAGLSIFARVDGLAVWLLGDLESDGQQALLSSTSDLRAAGDAAGGIVVVAHHGSARQSEPLGRALAPALAVFSVGPNAYGHPTEAALKLYGQAEVARTDQCGLVTVSKRGNAVVYTGDKCAPGGASD
ncbi:MAG: ComEC/Rec2 family competence protein [Micrococcales bacterium]|nr:ComEC/Rec2 family competence protein [Micrococcales bacterium]